jgi:hypothetical protein
MLLVKPYFVQILGFLSNVIRRLKIDQNKFQPFEILSFISTDFRTYKKMANVESRVSFAIIEFWYL